MLERPFLFCNAPLGHLTSIFRSLNAAQCHTFQVISAEILKKKVVAMAEIPKKGGCYG